MRPYIARMPKEKPPEKRTAEEQEILDAIARSRGWDWVNAHAEMILNQAHNYGDL
jgi:hypothetical protein